MRRVWAVVLGIVLAGPASAFDINNMSSADRSAFEAAVREYILNNPEVILEAVDNYQKKQQVQQAQDDKDLIAQNKQAIFEDGTSWVGGNPKGDITVVEFMDYKCGYCKKAYDDVKALVDGDGNIRFIVKEFPILGDESVLAARFAIAVQEVAGDKAYAAVHEELMKSRAAVNDAYLARVAKEQGLDYAKVKDVMGSDAVTNEIRANYDLARKLDINGTPGFVIEGELLRGYAPLDTMKQIVAKERG